jgi:hypothetical protein
MGQRLGVAKQQEHNLGIDPMSAVGTAKSGYDFVTGIFGGGGGEEWKNESKNYQAAPDDKVTFFEHSEYRGSYKSYGPGQSVSNLKNIGFNDKISSIKVPEGLRVVAYEDAGFSGSSKTITSDVDFNDQRFNDRISSFRIEGQAVQPSPTYQQPQTGSGQQQSSGGSSTSNLPANMNVTTAGMSPVAKYLMIGLGISALGGAAWYGIQQTKN